MQSIDGFEVDAVVVNKDLFPFSEPKINLEYDKIKMEFIVYPFFQRSFKTYPHFNADRRRKWN